MDTSCKKEAGEIIQIFSEIFKMPKNKSKKNLPHMMSHPVFALKNCHWLLHGSIYIPFGYLSSFRSF